MEKSAIRHYAKEIRAALDIKGISQILTERISSLEEYKPSKTVLLFYPKAGEIDITGLAINSDKNFCLPKTRNGEIIPCCWNSDTQLKLGAYDIYEPCSEKIPQNNLDIIILPGLCADKNRNRLGYGKGCYDKFLANTDALTILPIPDEMLFDNIPAESHDIKPDIIITPTKIIR